MSKWYDVYVERMNDRYREHVSTRYEPFISTIKDHIKDGDYVTEVGCGAANITRILAEDLSYWKNLKFHGLENCKKMRELAQMNLEKLRAQGKWVATTLCDVTEQVFHWEDLKPSVIHSHGLLEHFDDETIRKMISLQKATGARSLVHYVPGALYETPSFGCERLLSVDEWKRICEPTEIYTFNQGYDYALIWRNS